MKDRAKFKAWFGMKCEELSDGIDSVCLITPDGTEVELAYRRLEDVVSISINGEMLVKPVASNVLRITRAGP